MSRKNVIGRVLGNTSVSRKILAAVGISVLGTVAVAGVGALSLSSTADEAKASYTESTLGLVHVGEMRTALVEVQLHQALSSVRGSTISPQEELGKATAAGETFTAQARAYLDRTRPSPSQEKLAQGLLTTWATFQDSVGQALKLFAAGQVSEAVTFYSQSQTSMGELMTGIGALVDSETSDAAASAKRVADTNESALTDLIVALVIGAGASLALGWVIARTVRIGLGRVQAGAERLAEGDLTTETGIRQRDEVGRVAAALDAAQASLRTLMASVVASADAVAASSEELSASSAQISASAQETSAQSGVVSSAAEEVSRSVQTVAAGAEQMGASIREIASNAAEASEVASRAVDAAATTTATVAKLGESSAEIGNVVKVITSIAEQTNLLALNATIEAARAGEAGKGFAVVANEVKELAQETAKATEDIARRVLSIQGDTTAAVAAIDEISSIVAQISDRQTTIASAVEEQTATTNEMSRSVQEAAGGTTEIASNITGVSTAAESTTQALTQTRTAVDELSRMAADLRTTVGRFTY